MVTMASNPTHQHAIDQHAAEVVDARNQRLRALHPTIARLRAEGDDLVTLAKKIGTTRQTLRHHRIGDARVPPCDFCMSVLARQVAPQKHRPGLEGSKAPAEARVPYQRRVLDSPNACWRTCLGTGCDRRMWSTWEGHRLCEVCWKAITAQGTPEHIYRLLMTFTRFE